MIQQSKQSRAATRRDLCAGQQPAHVVETHVDEAQEALHHHERAALARVDVARAARASAVKTTTRRRAQG